MGKSFERSKKTTQSLILCCTPIRRRLEGEQKQERHHQTEKTHGFGKSEAQNGVAEQLLFQRWIASVADDQRTEYATNTSSRASDANSSRTGANKFRRRIDVPVHRRRVQAASDNLIAKRSSNRLNGRLRMHRGTDRVALLKRRQYARRSALRNSRVGDHHSRKRSNNVGQHRQNLRLRSC